MAEAFTGDEVDEGIASKVARELSDCSKLFLLPLTPLKSILPLPILLLADTSGLSHFPQVNLFLFKLDFDLLMFDL